MFKFRYLVGTYKRYFSSKRALQCRLGLVLYLHTRVLFCSCADQCSRFLVFFLHFLREQGKTARPINFLEAVLLSQIAPQYLFHWSLPASSWGARALPFRLLRERAKSASLPIPRPRAGRSSSAPDGLLEAARPLPVFTQFKTDDVFARTRRRRRRRRDASQICEWLVTRSWGRFPAGEPPLSYRWCPLKR